MRMYRFVLGLRRVALLSLVLGSTGVATWLMSQVIAANGLGVIGCAALVLFALNFGWLAASFWTAVFGFAVRLAGGELDQPDGRGRPSPGGTYRHPHADLQRGAAPRVRGPSRRSLPD